MEQENIATKECKHCHRTLAVTDFYKKSTSPDGLQYVCKQCQKEINRNLKRKKKLFGGVIPNSHALLRVSLWRNCVPVAIRANSNTYRQ